MIQEWWICCSDESEMWDKKLEMSIFDWSMAETIPAVVGDFVASSCVLIADLQNLDDLMESDLVGRCQALNWTRVTKLITYITIQS